MKAELLSNTQTLRLLAESTHDNFVLGKIVAKIKPYNCSASFTDRDLMEADFNMKEVIERLAEL